MFENLVNSDMYQTMFYVSAIYVEFENLVNSDMYQTITLSLM